MTTTTQDQMLRSLVSSTFTRRRMLAVTGISVGAVAAGGSLMGSAFAQDATPVEDMGMAFANPLEVLNYALTLEHLEASFYRDGLSTLGAEAFTGLGFQAGVFESLTTIGQQEATHVETLVSVIESLGGTPVAEATYDFGYTDAAGFLVVAQALEDTGVAAYQGAAQYLIDEDELLTAALTIHGVEARHASYLALLNATSPFPLAFNPTLTPDEVLEIAGPFIVG